MLTPVKQLLCLLHLTGGNALQEDLSQVFKAALAGGINYFDTAEVAVHSQHDSSFGMHCFSSELESECMPRKASSIGVETHPRCLGCQV